MKRIWKNCSLIIVLAACFTLSLAGQFVVGYKHFASTHARGDELPKMFGDDGFIWAFGAAVLENWQSEFLQLVSFVILSTYFVGKGDCGSKDTDEAMHAQLDRIESKLSHLEALTTGGQDMDLRSELERSAAAAGRPRW